MEKRKKLIVHTNKLSLLIIGLITILLNGCNTDPEQIRTGKDTCEFCKMTISDNRFGAEIVTKKSKVYKFDDEHCVMAFLNSKKVAQQDIGEIYFTDFSSPHKLINVNDAHFLQSPGLKSPMNGNIAAFSHEDSLTNMLPKFYGNKISWGDMQK